MAELESALSALRADFLRGASARLSEMAQLLDGLAEGSPGPDAARRLLSHFHGLAGAGGSYGFPRASELGREGEALCRRLLDARAPDRAEDLRRGRELLEGLRRELEGFDAAASPASTSSAASAPPRPFDVLVVEENRALRESLARALEREGISARTASTAAAAEAEISRAMPDGALVGAGAESPELVERLRALPGGDAVGVLVLSERKAFGDRVDAIHSGADGFFEKPIDLDAVLRRLQFLLERSRVEPPRILSVEDEPDQAAFLRAVLEPAGYQVRVCSNPARFPAELAGFRPDLVLMDVRLPGTTGYDLVRYLRQEETYAALPVVFLTTQGQLEARLEGTRAGGDEHLVKPVLPAILLTTVAARIERARFVRSLLERDGLTRLLTHTAFFERARAAIARHERDRSQPYALVMIDLDHFKAVNDRFGHLTGDRVLCSLANLLRRRLRQSDSIGRLGGEEFGVLLEGLTRPETLRLVRRLAAEFSAAEHRATDGSPFRVTFSAGVATLTEPGATLKSWRQAADAALYAAKNAGRNRVEGD